MAGSPELGKHPGGERVCAGGTHQRRVFVEQHETFEMADGSPDSCPLVRIYGSTCHKFGYGRSCEYQSTILQRLTGYNQLSNSVISIPSFRR